MVKKKILFKNIIFNTMLCSNSENLDWYFSQFKNIPKNYYRLIRIDNNHDDENIYGYKPRCKNVIYFIAKEENGEIVLKIPNNYEKRIIRNYLIMRNKKIIICSNCSKELHFEDVHSEGRCGGITHTCYCGYDLSTGNLGNTYGKITDGSCEKCKII